MCTFIRLATRGIVLVLLLFVLWKVLAALLGVAIGVVTMGVLWGGVALCALVCARYWKEDRSLATAAFSAAVVLLWSALNGVGLFPAAIMLVVVFLIQGAIWGALESRTA